jgi:tyrosinase
MRSYTSPPLDVPVLDPEEPIDRADLVFYGVDHSGPSYIARVFVDTPDASEDTPLDDDHGFVGVFTVFGHDGCYGDAGHCTPELRTTDAFDLRAPHPLTRWTKTLIAGKPLLDRLEDASVTQVTISVVAVSEPSISGTEPDDGPLQFDSVRLLAYQD